MHDVPIASSDTAVPSIPITGSKQSVAAAAPATPQTLSPRLPSPRVFDWNALSAVTSAIALIFLAGALFYNHSEVRTARQIAQAQYLMNYYAEFQKFNDLQLRLISGDWSQAKAGPASPEDWYRVARYMGLLEQIEVMVQDGIMTQQVADRSYSHRVHAIYRNDRIRRRYLENEKFRWQLFLSLVKRLETMPVYEGLRRRDGSLMTDGDKTSTSTSTEAEKSAGGPSLAELPPPSPPEKSSSGGSSGGGNTAGSNQ